MITNAPWIAVSALAWLGPLVGVLCTLWGGMIGVFGYYFVKKGRGRIWVYSYIYAGLVIAILSCAAGLIGILSSQPMPIYASLLGLGCPLLIGATFSLLSIGKAYRMVELRRMHALEQ